MKKLFIIALISFIPIKGQAQSHGGEGIDIQGTDASMLNSPNNIILSGVSNLDKEKTIGSPYVSDFSLAKVSGFNENYLIRYNAFNDEMHAKNPDNKIVNLSKGLAKEVNFNNGAKYIIYNYDLNNDNKIGYLKVVHEEKNTKLLKKEMIKFFPAKKAASGYEKNKPNEYKKTKSLYFILIDKKVNYFTNKKSILELFPEKKLELQGFIKSNNIKFSREADLIKMTSFLSSTL